MPWQVVMTRQGLVCPLLWINLTFQTNLTDQIETHFDSVLLLLFHLHLSLGAIEVVPRVDAVVGVAAVAPNDDGLFFCIELIDEGEGQDACISSFESRLRWMRRREVFHGWVVDLLDTPALVLSEMRIKKM